MVQLSSMAHALNTTAAGTVGSAGTTDSTTASAGDSFAQELETAIEGIVSQSGNGSQFEIDIQSGKSANGGNDYTITVKNLGSAGTISSTAAPSQTATAPQAASKLAATAQATPSPAPAATSPTSVLDELMPSPAGTTPAIYTPPAATTTPATIDKSKMTPDDAYWAEQPPAVQALRNMGDADVGPAAMKLAQEGYQIDVPIMVWHWDPLTTMIERQNYGYTWVPSALQSPVQLPPGLSFPGLPSYDANNPPTGSIKVTTDFAAGTNMQDPFIDPATITASLSPAAQSQTAATTQTSI